MAHPFHIVDVFAETLHAGNTLAVVRDAADLDTGAMQRIAREFGFSETSFIVSDPRAADTAGVRVRIFTPQVELPFAGHPSVEMGRPSLLRLEASNTGRATRIRVGGRVIESARGELL
jgi:trans-2,3-dihydro-3-hydroxyanthranilate isomerase